MEHPQRQRLESFNANTWVIPNDPLAVRILGDDADAIIEHARSDPGSRPLRLFIAARSRYAENSVRGDQIEDLSLVEIAARFLPGRVGAVSDRGGHILHAQP